ARPAVGAMPRAGQRPAAPPYVAVLDGDVTAAGAAAGAALTGAGAGAGVAASAARSSQALRGCHELSASRWPTLIICGLCTLCRLTHHRAGQARALPYSWPALLHRSA